jgi:hypothetical protein
MLGQHPRLYALPETHLFCDETLGERARRVAGETYPMGHGLLRAVAELYFGGQTARTIRQAQMWLWVRSHVSTAFAFKMLADRVWPRSLVDKSPSTPRRLDAMQRVKAHFPGARFIHLLRHPRGYSESIVRYVAERAQHGPMPRSHWLLQNVDPDTASIDNPEHFTLDPQYRWLSINATIRSFLDEVPESQKMEVHGERLLSQPDVLLPQIASWLGLETSVEQVENMKHPERSPYAHLGPPGARYGNDVFFLRSPALRPGRAVACDVDTPLSWLIEPVVLRRVEDGRYAPLDGSERLAVLARVKRSHANTFSAEVKTLARAVGYV